MPLVQPSQSKTYANIEMKQGEDFELILTMSSPWTSASKTYSAKIVKDFAGGTFLYNGVTETVAAFDSVVASGTDGGTITLKIEAANTQKYPDSFEGYWDLIEKDSNGNFIKQAQGEVSVDSTATPTF